MLLLNVPYAEKDQAKQLGAKWDAGSKKWHAPAGVVLALFEQWLPSALAANALLGVKSAAGKARGAKKPRKAATGRTDASAGRITVGVNYVPQEGATGLPWV